jgi:predicted flap endonuclease-1-like 5' DNA nuclease
MINFRAYFGLITLFLLSSCNAFKQKVNIGPGTAEFRDHSLEILTMLGGAFALGLWLGWILWNKYKAMVDGLRSENESLTTSFTNLKTESDALRLNYTKLESDKNDLQTQYNSLSWENADFKSKLVGVEGDLENLMARNRTLESELSMKFASTPESAEVPMEIISSPVDVHVEDLATPIDIEVAQVETPTIEITEVETPEVEVAEVEAPVIETPTIDEFVIPIAEPEVIETPVVETVVEVVPPVVEVSAPIVTTRVIETPRVTFAEPIVYKKTLTTTSRIVDIEDPAPSSSVTTSRIVDIEDPAPSSAYTTSTSRVLEVVETVRVEEPVVEVIAEPIVIAEPEPTLTFTDVSTPIIAPAVIAERKDDLKIVEGIGPKIEELLFSNGIISYTQLAATPVNRIKEILVTSGPSYAMHDPGTWPAQALLAANGEWDNLKSYQSFLNAGKKPS